MGLAEFKGGEREVSLLIQVASFKIVYKKIANYFLNNDNDILITYVVN